MNIVRIGRWILLSAIQVSILYSSEIVLPKSITPEWEEKVLGLKHGPVTLDAAIKELTKDCLGSRFDTKFINRIKDHIEKHPSGVYEEYWPNKQIKVRLPYKNKMPHGHIHGWFINGRDAFKGYFQEGIRQGSHITFSDLAYAQKMVRRCTFDEKGRFYWMQFLCHQNGEIKLVLHYKNGKANGALEGWDEEGKYVLSGNYKNGKLLKQPLPKPIQRKRFGTTEMDRYIDEVRDEFIREARKEFGVRAFSSGAYMPYDIESISAHFELQKKGSIEHARKLIIDLGQLFLSIINNHKELKLYLREYPSTFKRINVAVVYCDSEWNRYNDGSICKVSFGELGIIRYRKELGKKNSEVILEEPYEEAVKIVYGDKE